MLNLGCAFVFLPWLYGASTIAGYNTLGLKCVRYVQVRLRIAYSIYICLLRAPRRAAYGALRRAAGGRAPQRAAGRWMPRRYRGPYMLAIWEREDTEGAPSERQERFINSSARIFYQLTSRALLLQIWFSFSTTTRTSLGGSASCGGRGSGTGGLDFRSAFGLFSILERIWRLLGYQVLSNPTFKIRQITRALFLDQPTKAVEFRGTFFRGSPLGPGPYFQFLSPIFRQRGLVM
jgi:hypothetical protein